MKDSLTNPDSQTTTYSYNNLGALAQIIEPNNTVTEYTYNNRNQLTLLINKDSSQAVLSSYTYTYDNAGNRLTVTESDGSVVSYGYDDIYQLTSETKTGANPYSVTYQYDDAGNRIQMIKNGATTSYTYNNGNQLTHSTGATYNYDNNSNLISETNGTNTTNYTWDWENRLIQITNNQNTITNQYDALGKRIAVTENGATTKYLYDGMLPVIEKDATDTTIATYTRGLSSGGGIGGVISAKRGENNYYYHYNGIGSVTGLTDSASAVVATYDYDSYGNTLSSSGSVPNPYGFSTKEFSASSGLIYFGARYYNPTTGRWLSQDPLGMVNGPNMYAYCSNNVANLIDPWGMAAMSVVSMPNINGIFRDALAAHKCEILEKAGKELESIRWALYYLVLDMKAYWGLRSTWWIAKEKVTGHEYNNPHVVTCEEWQEYVMSMLYALNLKYWKFYPRRVPGINGTVHGWVVLKMKYFGQRYIIDPYFYGSTIIRFW